MAKNATTTMAFLSVSLLLIILSQEMIIGVNGRHLKCKKSCSKPGHNVKSLRNKRVGDNVYGGSSVEFVENFRPTAPGHSPEELTKFLISRKHLKAYPQQEKKMEPQGFKSHLEKIIRKRSRRERKSALIQDVDELKKKLRHEESVHRALKSALNRPLGTLPSISTHLPRYTLELVAEVAVLEEDVVRLEEQVVRFRQLLHKESVPMPSIMSAEDSACCYRELSVTTPKRGHMRSLSQNDVKTGSALAWPPPSHSRRSVSSKKTWCTWLPQV